MRVALIGILGVLLGGFLNASFTYFLARRSEGGQTRIAARLVLPELLENRQRLESALHSKRWRSVEFQTQRWRQHELAIAGGFGKEWSRLASVYTALMLLNSDRQFYDDDERIVDPDDLGYMRLAGENLDDAIGALRRWAGVDRNEVLMLPGID